MNQLMYDIMPEGMAPQAPERRTFPPINTGMTHEPGIYFGMPDTEYHAIKALSASAIKRLLISSMDYWSGSWMNPYYQDKETEAKELGTAYHVRILEGKGAFYDRYAPAFDETAYPDALDTNDQLKAALKSMDLKVGGNKADLIARLREADPSIQIMADLQAEYEAQHPGKDFVKPSVIRETEIAAFMIDNDPVASKCFTGGYPEVSVIWIDPLTKVPMKARFDYLKIKAITDLKSFSNPLGKSLHNAIGSTVASRKHHIQAATYLEGSDFAAAFARKGRVFGDADQDWLKSFSDEKDRRFVFVFQQTGISPVTRVKEFSKVLETYKIAVQDLRRAQLKFAECWNHYGTDPWLDLAPLEQFGDEDFPLYILEI